MFDVLCNQVLPACLVIANVDIVLPSNLGNNNDNLSLFPSLSVYVFDHVLIYQYNMVTVYLLYTSTCTCIKCT